MSKAGVKRVAVPTGALLNRYGDGSGHGARAYTDAYSAAVTIDVPLPTFIDAFYSTPLFRLERFALGLAGLGTNDDEVKALASAERDRFAAWTVEARTDNEILLCDVHGRTRSWLMCERGVDSTELFFGSAVVAANKRAGRETVPWQYRWLFPLHRWYSRALLSATLWSLRSQAVHS
ncbi:MAG: hypothetical protein AAGH76_10975 [Pseudomonadota bacterium]